jgi:hypothetical protein
MDVKKIEALNLPRSNYSVSWKFLVALAVVVIFAFLIGVPPYPMAAESLNFRLIGMFFFGMLVQAFMMLAGKWKPGDWKWVLGTFATGLIGMLPGDDEEIYSLSFHLFYSCALGAIFFTAHFRKQLLLRIGARSLLIMNVLFAAIIIDRFGLSWPLIILFAIPTILTLLNAFTDFDHHLFWQVLFYVWFTVMVIGIGLYNFAFNDLSIFNWTELAATGPLSVAFTGAGFLFLLCNIWFVLALIPIPGKHQKMSERIVEVKEHIQLLAYGYVRETGDEARNLIYLIFMVAILLVNYTFSIVEKSVIISAMLAFTPILSGLKKEVSIVDDGIGKLPGDNIYT